MVRYAWEVGDTAPQTRVDQIMRPIEDALRLATWDTMPQVMERGLYDAPSGRPVAVYDDEEIVAIVSAERLRSEILPRSWTGSLKRRLARVSPPPEITASTRVAELDYLVQSAREFEWFLVVDDDTGRPVGIVSREMLLGYQPRPRETGEPSSMGAPPLLWGDAEVKHTFYYCPIEKRYYGSNAVHPDEKGRMRDRRGHLVEKHDPPSTN